MELFNSIIEKTAALGGSAPPRRYAYDPADAWPDAGEFQLIMLRDAAYELGGGNHSAVNFTCVTTSPKLIDRDEILVYGPDLTELKADADYARITLLRVGDIESDDVDDTEQAFRAIQDMDFVKYHVFPKGYMIRTSSESSREQVRISKEAVRSGVSFRRIGADFIRQYKKNTNILNVRMLFITAPDGDYEGTKKLAKNVKDITMSLTKILDGMPTDCGSCQLKPICDEVEGMKELHFGKEKQAGK